MVAKIIGIVILIPLLLAACSPEGTIRQVTPEEANQVLVNNMPVFEHAQVILPASPIEQTIDHLTVQIYQFYKIDTHTLAISVIATNPSQTRYAPPSLSFTTLSGLPYKIFVGEGISSTTDPHLGIRIPAGEQVDIFFFNTPDNTEISLPLEGTLTLTYHELPPWYELIKNRPTQSIGPFQLQFTLPQK